MTFFHNFLSIFFLSCTLSILGARQIWPDDCNANGISDDLDISTGNSADVDKNGIPDECQVRRAWVDRREGGGLDIAVAASGHVYVTGLSGTVKYDSDGTEIWSVPGSGIALALDGDGNVYVTGTWGGNYLTRKYDATNGNELWAKSYDGPGGGDDSPRAIALDSAGNVCVTGSSVGSGTGWDYATVTYNAEGKELWAKTYDGPGSSRDEAMALALDDEGNVYVTGLSVGSGTITDYATLKYDENGNELWVARYDGPISEADEARAVGVDAEGNVYVTGSSKGSSTGIDNATIKYNAEGKELWVRRKENSSGYNEANALAITITGAVYMTGHSGMIKYDPGGNELWAVDVWNIRDLALDGEGNVYFTADHDEYFTAKYDPNGNEFWTARYDGIGYCWGWGGENFGPALALDAAGNVYITSNSFVRDRDFKHQVTIKYVAGAQESFLRGDVNIDGRLDISDALQIVAFMFGWFGSEDVSFPCVAAANTNNTCPLSSISQAIGILYNLFSGGGSFLDATESETCNSYDPAPPPIVTDVALGFEGCPAVISGNPGEVKAVRFFATLTTSANASDLGAFGWSISMAAENATIKDVKTGVDDDDVATDASTLYKEGWQTKEMTSGGTGECDGREGAMSAMILDFGPTPIPTTLPPSGTSTIAAIDLEVVIPEEETTATIRYADGCQGSGQPVTNVVSFEVEIPEEGHLIVSQSPTLGTCTIILRPGILFRRGDVDGNGALEVTDVINFLNYAFVGSEEAPGCLDAADVDDNGTLDVTDAITNLNFQFIGGKPPAPPGPFECGPDVDEDAFPPCEYPAEMCE